MAVFYNTRAHLTGVGADSSAAAAVAALWRDNGSRRRSPVVQILDLVAVVFGFFLSLEWFVSALERFFSGLERQFSALKP